MDRAIVYPGAIPQDLDVLQTNKDAMVGLGMFMLAILGSTTIVDGLPCTPTSPASMTVNVGSGSIYALENIDDSAYGTIAADTANQIVKQGIVLGATNFACPAPATSGFSRAYLIQATYTDSDTGDTVLPYYNASNPAVPFNGPNNTGVSQKTVRKGVCQLTLKAGTPATTGTQVLPAADIGAVPLYSVTVSNGQTTITSGSIAQLVSGNGFITPKLPAIIPTVQSGAPFYAQDSSGAANTITAALNPIIAAYQAGMTVRIKVANTNTGATVMNINGVGSAAVKTNGGAALPAGTLTANGVYDFTYDGTSWQVESNGALFASNNLSDLASLSTALTNLGFLTSAGSAGYLKLPGGIIIQWLVSPGTVTTAGATLSLPLAFPNNFYKAFATHSQAKGAATFAVSANPNGLSQVDVTSASGSGTTINVFAIGN